MAYLPADQMLALHCLEEEARLAVVLDPEAGVEAWEQAMLLLSWRMMEALPEQAHWSCSAVACLLEANLMG